MAALSLIAIFLLFAFVSPMPKRRRARQARIAAAKAHIATFSEALEAFKKDCKRYPATAEGLAALLDGVERVKGWRGPYLAERLTQKDPWGQPYRYLSPGVHNEKGYDLSSAGPDGKFDTEDDLVNWDAGR